MITSQAHIQAHTQATYRRVRDRVIERGWQRETVSGKFEVLNRRAPE